MSAQKLLAEVGRHDAEVSVLLVDDPYIRNLNREWRGVDKSTDVLSWSQEDYDAEDRLPVPMGKILGDVVISLETLARQAHLRGWSDEEEGALLLVHGVLHLLGHEDESEDGAAEMQAIETRLLGKPLNGLNQVQ